MGKFFWFYLPIGICVFMNFILLMIVIHKICSVDILKKSIATRTSGRDNQTDVKER